MTNFDLQFDSPDTTADSFSEGIDILGILQRRKWIVVATTIVALLLGVLWYTRAEPVYESTAQVLIERKQTMSLPVEGAGNMQQRAYMDAFKHPVVMRSPNIIAAAFDQGKLAELPFMKQLKNPVQHMISNLEIEPVKDTMGIYNVSFRGSDRQEIGKVPNAVIEAYQDSLERTHRSTNEETRQLITRMKDELFQQLAMKEKAYTEFRKTAPLIWKADGAGTNIHLERQLAIEDQRREVQKRITELKTKITVVTAAVQRGDDAESLLVSFELPNFSDPSRRSTGERLQRSLEDTQLFPMLLEEGELTSRYGKDHPKVKSIRRRIEFWKDFDAQLEAKIAAAAEAGDLRLWDRKSQVEHALTTFVNHLNHNIEQLQLQAAELDEEFHREEQATRELNQYVTTDGDFRSDIARTQQLFDVVVKRFEEVSLVKDDQGYNFQKLALAGGGRKVEPDLFKTLGASTALGLLMGGLLAYLVDLSDKSFHSPLEISQQLSVPVVGHIPLITPEDFSAKNKDVHIDNVVCTLHNPKSQNAESYRTIRTALFFNARGSKHQVIQITSPRPSDGKSTLAANLAVTIANSGKSTLLLDADFRRPTQHKKFGLESEVGLASVVAGMVEAEEAYQTVPSIPNLTIMSCGPRPANPSELLSSVGFSGCLEYLREQFEYVIVDTPPLLAVSDPSAVAGQVDGVLLTMRIDKQARPVAQRAVDMLREIGAEIAGVVINGVGNRSQPGYYAAGNYRYGYAAEKYGYGYKYAYDEEPTGNGELPKLEHEEVVSRPS